MGLSNKVAMETDAPEAKQITLMQKLRLLFAAAAAMALMIVGGAVTPPATAFSDEASRPTPNDDVRIFSAQAGEVP